MSASSISGVSCVECQRRKQKCNRHFPCNHCSKRGVAHLCRFISRMPQPKTSKSDPSVNDGLSRASRKRNLDVYCDSPANTADEEVDDSAFDASDALAALGYMPHTHHLVLGNGNNLKIGIDSVEENEKREQSDEVRAALPLVPPKPYTDCLVDNWLNGANYHYYALYPAEFRTQYDGWWAAQTSNATPELTSLILRVCACSALFIIDDNVKERLESELKTDALTFANCMHDAAEKLSASIPHGKGGLVHVQQLFLTAFWLKSAERWTEAWHALSAAIRAAYEIGLHQDSLSDGLSEFDREMRRRLWCVLYLWDFALGSMLSRPMLINRADCTFEMPTLALEIDLAQPYQPSPFRHMKLHCQMCVKLAKVLASVPSENARTDLAPRMRNVVEDWFETLPEEYALERPDTRWDGEHSWVVFQRRYLHLVGYMSLLGPLKPYVTRDSSKPMSDLESELRAGGVGAALALMNVSWSLFENMVSAGAKFHYAVFCIFDTTTVLCSAIVHDQARSLPQREVVLEAILKGAGMLERLHSVSKTTSDLCRILKGLLTNLPLDSEEKVLVGVRKRPRPDHPTRAIRKDAGPLSHDSNRRIESSHSPPGVVNSAASTSESPVAALEHPDDGQSQRFWGTSHSGNDVSPSNCPSSTTLLSNQNTSPSPPTMPTADGLIDLYRNGTVAAPEGFLFTNDPAEARIPAAAYDHQFNTFQSAPFATGPESQAEWPACADGNRVSELYSATSLTALDPTMPTVLDYWDWQGLDLGHPGFWGQPPPQL